MRTLCGSTRFFFFFQAEDGIRDHCVTGVQTCALPICGLAARLTCWALRLPSSAMRLEARLAIARDGESERWARTFGRRLLVTIQRGLPDGTLAERFGALEFRFHLRVAEGALTYIQAGAGVMVGRLRIPLPRWISPRVEAREASAGGRGAYVRVGISAPGFGLVMSYEGCVQVERP